MLAAVIILVKERSGNNSICLVSTLTEMVLTVKKTWKNCYKLMPDTMMVLAFVSSSSSRMTNKEKSVDVSIGTKAHI